MPRECCVLGCFSQSSQIAENQTSMFKVPSMASENGKKWRNALGEFFNEKHGKRKFIYICHSHFEEECFENGQITVFRGGVTETVSRIRRRLKDGKLPTVFSNNAVNVLKSDKEASVEVLPCSTIGEMSSLVNSSCNTSNDSPGTAMPSSSHTLYGIEMLKKDWESCDDSRFAGPWGLSKTPNGVQFLYILHSEASSWRGVVVSNDMSVQLLARGVPVTYPALSEITCFNDVMLILHEVSTLQMCDGPGFGSFCKVGFYKKAPTRKSNRCDACQRQYRKNMKNNRRREKRASEKTENLKKRGKTLKQKVRRSAEKITKLQTEVKLLQKKMEEIQSKCAGTNEELLNQNISGFPKEMQEAIKTCWRLSKCSDKRDMRYTKEWILECLLLRIKSRKAYLHLLHHQLLPLPCFNTLNKYIKSLKPSYGFDPALFAALKKKAVSMKPEEKRGVLVLDEMAISEGVYFDEHNLTVGGFTDLGQWTPTHQKNERANEALVFMYQPFRGNWVQNIAAFLSKGCATGKVLKHLVAECILLMEDSGFLVDVVTSDGATWNRTMWKSFGLVGNDASCPHISLQNIKDCKGADCSGDCCAEDEEVAKAKRKPQNRRLWFCSDFSHLLKNLRNFVVKHESTWTPDGVIHMKHLRAVMRLDCDSKHMGLKLAYKLTPDHLDPKYYQKMNVGLALELFSDRVAAAMEVYHKKFLNDPDLQDCQSTINFIRRIHNLIEAMTSRSSLNALSPNSKASETIANFIKYLQTWEASTMEFLSSSTSTGLYVTLTATLEVMTFLTEDCGYNFLMTARLNQDALEV